MQFPSNIPLKFAKARSSKKKKEEREGATGKSGKNKDPAELLKSSRDLSLRDTSQFVMYEYSVSVGVWRSMCSDKDADVLQSRRRSTRPYFPKWAWVL